MFEIFEDHLPESLYMNHYELTEHLGYSPKEWKKFLKEHRQFIEQELAEITEAEARSALHSLTDPSSNHNVTALKELINKAQFLKEKHNQRPTVIMTHLPKKQSIQRRREEYRRELEDF